MKKAITIVLILVLILTCVACSSVDSVILSTSSCEIVAGETFELSYSIIPENADTSKLIWKSADDSIATVEQNGIILAHKKGQTSVFLTDGKKTFATCSVTVLRKAAYDLLNDEERAFVDMALKNISVFKNPDSVSIVDLGYVPNDSNPSQSFWVVEVSAQNSFGGTNSEIYVLDNQYGFHENPYIFMVPADTIYYRVDLINEAISDRR